MNQATTMAANATPDRLDQITTVFPSARSTSCNGRVLAVADVADALRTGRPYRAAMPIDQVLAVDASLRVVGCLGPV